MCGAIAWAVLTPGSLWAQDNDAIQVYGSETATADSTFVALHSNYTINGRKAEQEGLRPTDHAFHETLEITHGFTPPGPRPNAARPGDEPRDRVRAGCRDRHLGSGQRLPRIRCRTFALYPSDLAQ